MYYYFLKVDNIIAPVSYIKYNKLKIIEKS